MPTSKNRSKFYSFIAYAENMDIDKIRNYLKTMHYSAAISPLHSPDPDFEGVELKPHYHVVVCFPNPRVCDSVRDEFNAVANIAMPQRVGDIRAMTRYLTHMDNPEKEQFSTVVEVYGSYPYEKYVYRTPDSSEDSSNMMKVIEYLNDLFSHSKHLSFVALIIACCGDPELVTFILRNSYAVNVVVNDFNRFHK